MAQRLHDAGHVDVVGTAGGAGLTRKAQPQRTVVQRLVLETELHRAHDLADLAIVELRAGTTRRTVAALVARGKILAALLLHGVEKVRVPGEIKPDGVHRDFLLRNVLVPDGKAAASPPLADRDGRRAWSRGLARGWPVGKGGVLRALLLEHTLESKSSLAPGLVSTLPMNKTT